jgi:hypothetical protein
LTLEFIRERCPEFRNVKLGTGPADLRDCKVLQFGEAGSIDGRTFHYAIYCLIPNYSPDPGRCGDDSFAAAYHAARGLAVFESEKSGGARLLLERADSDVGTLRYPAEPRIVRNASGPLLYVPIAVDGTGNFNESEYYLYVDGAWRHLESTTWTKDLLQQIPADLQIWKGIWPDPETLEADAGLYRARDGNCCPTGGRARIKLAIQSGRFVVESVVVERTD